MITKKQQVKKQSYALLKGARLRPLIFFTT